MDKDIIKHSLTNLNQGTVRPDGAGWSFRLADGRKSFGKTGTSEDLAVSGGSFIPNQIAAFAVVGDARNPYTNRISNIAINGPVQQLLGWFDNRGSGRYQLLQ